jgi:predicted PurR-regulated permease PerM
MGARAKRVGLAAAAAVRPRDSQLDQVLRMASTRMGGVLAESAGFLARGVVFVIVNVVIVLFALFFFFKDGDAIMGRIRRVLPFDPSFSEDGLPRRPISSARASARD